MTNAFVTGGAGGLGAAIAAGLISRGVGVALVDRSLTEAESAAERLRTEGGPQVLALSCDVSSSEDVETAWSAAEAALGRIEVVVNCAGIWQPRPLVEMDDESWQRTIDVNLTGAFYVCRRAAKAWIPAATAGSIVNVTSVAAHVAAPLGSTAYGSSKAGLTGLTVHLAVELGGSGIRTNAVAPGSFRSPMSANRLEDPEQEEKSNAMVPLGRVGETDEVAGAVVYLALDATYVNGVTMALDGGTIIRM
jgi:NAD(P)-dependent dehydrogenase (short-subunit alcohol dehydrogenase family)